MHSIASPRIWRRTLYLMIGLSCMAAATPRPNGPSPDLRPVQVVQRQLAALRSDDMNAGIRQAYRFASPGNRRAVGSVSNFGEMLRKRYGDMITQTSAQVSLKLQQGDTAQVRAELTQADGRKSAYLFVLERQRAGDCAGCWLTAGVFALQPDRPEPLYSI